MGSAPYSRVAVKIKLKRNRKLAYCRAHINYIANDRSHYRLGGRVPWEKIFKVDGKSGVMSEVTIQQKRREIIDKVSSLLEASAGKVRSNLRQSQRWR